MPRRVRTVSLTLALAGAAMIFSTHLHADPPEPSHPTTANPTILQQLSDDTQRLYLQSRHSMVRVQLPTPQWLEQINDQQEFLRKWGPMMDPVVRQKVEEQYRTLGNLREAPTTAPSTAPTAIASTQPIGIEIRSVSGYTLFAVGVLVDDQGHAVFPVFVDRKIIGKSALPALTGDGISTTATFVGSDAKTNLTVLQLENHTGTPAPLGHRRPEDGVLTLSIASDGGAKLVVWNNQHPEPGLAILTDGSLAGFGFEGHFLGAATAKPIVDQLVAYGEVHRAFLGVWTMEVMKDDPIRRQSPELGSSPAIRIMAVQEGSAAARGGICKDDLILTIGDQAVGDPPTFAAVIATRRGDTSLKVLRGSKVIDLTVNLQPKQ
jgi:PDZ domain